MPGFGFRAVNRFEKFWHSSNRGTANAKTAKAKTAFSLGRRRVTKKQLSLFCRQLSVMLHAGIPLLQALRVLYEQLENSPLKDAIDGISGLLEEGYGFSFALGQYPQIFPGIVVSMVSAGEAGGVLGSILESVSGFLDWEHRIREKVKNSIAYPLVVLAMSALAVSFMVTFILPVFGRILTQMNAELPGITKFLLALSRVMSTYWPLVLGFLTCSVICLIQVEKRSEQVREAVDILILRIPIIGSLTKKVIISRFCKTLATLLSVGIPVMTALEIVEKTIGNVVVQKSVARCRKSIFDGRGMAGPLKETGVFSSVVIEMITVGEETGALAVMLQRAGEFYDEEVDNYSGKLTAVIEPLLICLVGAVVCVVLLSVFLPMFKVIGTVG